MYKNKDEYIKLLNVVSVLLSISLIILNILIIPWGDVIEKVINTEPSALVLLLTSIISICISVFISTFSIINVNRKYREQQKRLNAILNYHMLVNKGNYNLELEKLYNNDLITSIELKKLHNTHDVINSVLDDHSKKKVEENLDGVYNVLDKLAKDVS